MCGAPGTDSFPIFQAGRPSPAHVPVIILTTRRLYFIYIKFGLILFLFHKW
jgi:hypothetical protein